MKKLVWNFFGFHYLSSHVLGGFAGQLWAEVYSVKMWYISALSKPMPSLQLSVLSVIQKNRDQSVPLN